MFKFLLVLAYFWIIPEQISHNPPKDIYIYIYIYIYIDTHKGWVEIEIVDNNFQDFPS